MSAYWCGFNGFNQITASGNSYSSSSSAAAVFEFKPIPLNDVKDIDFTWSCAVVLSVGDVYMSGFCGNRFTYFKKVKKYKPELKFLKVACSDTYAILITENDECWQYFYDSEKWKKLADFINVEEQAADATETSLKPLNKNDKSNFQDEKNKRITKICCGEIVNIALDDKGQAYSIPSPIVLPGIKITEVACGFEHCLLLDDFGRVYSTGSGMRGQLGCEVLETVDSPQEIKVLGGLQVIHIAAGGWHSAAVTTSGVLYTWGWNNSGQLGLPSAETSKSLYSSGHGTEEDENESMSTCKTKKRKLTEDELHDLNKDETMEPKEHVTVLAVPKPVDFLSRTDVNVVAVSCGNRHTIALADDGTVWGCGWNAYGQLGISPDSVNAIDTMIRLNVPIKENISGIHCGGWNTVLFVRK